jgi:hypothetical protein
MSGFGPLVDTDWTRYRRNQALPRGTRRNHTGVFPQFSAQNRQQAPRVNTYPGGFRSSGPTGCGGSSPPARTRLTCANASKRPASVQLRPTGHVAGVVRDRRLDRRGGGTGRGTRPPPPEIRPEGRRRVLATRPSAARQHEDHRGDRGGGHGRRAAPRHAMASALTSPSSGSSRDRRAVRAPGLYQARGRNPDRSSCLSRDVEGDRPRHDVCAQPSPAALQCARSRSDAAQASASTACQEMRISVRAVKVTEAVVTTVLVIPTVSSPAASGR